MQPCEPGVNPMPINPRNPFRKSLRERGRQSFPTTADARSS